MVPLRLAEYLEPVAVPVIDAKGSEIDPFVCATANADENAGVPVNVNVV